MSHTRDCETAMAGSCFMLAWASGKMLEGLDLEWTDLMAESKQVNQETQAVAAVDIGSNSIRMAIAEVSPDGEIEVLERVQRAVHLGQDTFVSGRLATRTMNAAISILGDFRRILSSYGVGHVRAVATSAVREATNVDAFLDRIYMATALDVDVISTSEESRLKVAAVRDALAEAPEIDLNDALVVEIGGGTALLTLLHEGDIVKSESYRLGSIRLQELLSLTDEPPAKTAELIRHQIAGMLSAIATSLEMRKVETFFAVGGDARFAALQIGKRTGSGKLSTISPKQFDKLVGRLEGLSVNQLTHKYDLTLAQAETLVPALLIYQALIHETAARRIIASQTSMRDGLLLGMSRRLTGGEDDDLAEGVVQSARAICEKYRCDMSHATHVADLSLKLFDELEAEHGLGRRDRLLLRTAAMLHEVGAYVSGRAHHKHSYYLISYAEIFGLTGEELQMVALVTRYHRRGGPKQTHPEYIALPRERRVEVSKMAALLRVADALDRGHGQQVQDFHIERHGDEVVLLIHGVSELALERLAMEKKANLFEDIYGLRVRLEEAPLAGKTNKAGRGKSRSPGRAK